MRAWPRLLVAAGALAVAGVVVVLLGLDAAAEMPLNANRFSALLGTGLGGLALLLTAAGLVAADGQRRLAQRRAALRAELFEALGRVSEEPVQPARRRRRAR